MSELYGAYCRWCDEEGTKPISAKALHAALDKRKYGRLKDTRGGRYRTGLAYKGL